MSCSGEIFTEFHKLIFTLCHPQSKIQQYIYLHHLEIILETNSTVFVIADWVLGRLIIKLLEEFSHWTVLTKSYVLYCLLNLLDAYLSIFCEGINPGKQLKELMCLWFWFWNSVGQLHVSEFPRRWHTLFLLLVVNSKEHSSLQYPNGRVWVTAQGMWIVIIPVTGHCTISQALCSSVLPLECSSHCYFYTAFMVHIAMFYLIVVVPLVCKVLGFFKY